MFLKMTLQVNEELVSIATWLHRKSYIRPNTYVLDVDAITTNTRNLTKFAKQYDLKLYAMTKQFGRNPRVMHAIAEAGISKVVAVDFDEAKVLYNAGYKIGNIGHLVACARSEVKAVLDMKPDVITVFNVDQARRIDQEAAKRKIKQDLLIRIYDPQAFSHPGQHGGFHPDKLDKYLNDLMKLESIRVVGVTAHPCLYYDYETAVGGPTQNLTNLKKAYAFLKGSGLPMSQLNAPGVSCCSTFPILSEEGVTHAEPGSSFTGSTPLHAHNIQPEKPAIVYVTEVSHFTEKKVHTFGGGFYARGHIKGALIVNSKGNNIGILPAEKLPAEAIDYYGTLQCESDKKIRVGDTAVYAFRSQVFVTRAYVATVSGIAQGKAVLTGIYDSRGVQKEAII
jgi:predicted amino acid racemase